MTESDENVPYYPFSINENLDGGYEVLWHHNVDGSEPFNGLPKDKFIEIASKAIKDSVGKEGIERKKMIMLQIRKEITRASGIARLKKGKK